MIIRFYFDYSDYRSYLMMHSLRAIEDLPVSVKWIAVDAYSLRALSQCASRDTSVHEREFLKREAIRFCKREKIDFVWQNERIFLGSVLRIGIQLMLKSPEKFESFSREILTEFWGLGKSIDTQFTDQILSNLGIQNPDQLSRGSEQDSFQFQDACLQEALNLGIFDVPTLVIGQDLICHFDQAQELRRIVLTHWLHTLPLDSLSSICADLLLSVPKEELHECLSSLTRQSDIRQADHAQDPSYIQIQHTLTVPEAIYPIPKKSSDNPIYCHICDLDPNHVLAPVYKSNYLNLNVHTVSDADRAFAGVSCNGSDILCIQPQPDGVIAALCVTHKTKEIHTNSKGTTVFHFGSLCISLLSASDVRDLNCIRYVAYQGVHIIICPQSSIPSEAFAPIANAWVIQLSGHDATLISPNAHRFIPTNTDTELLESHAFTRWMPPASRTLLLCEQPILFGECYAGADLELSCRGLNLLVSSAHQTSELSHSRPFDRIPVKDAQILLLPLFADQLFIIDLIFHRLLETINQSPQDAIPFMVSYWNELEFQKLDTIRPMIAALIAMIQIPIILVVGSQIVEIWCLSLQGVPYIIEKEDDCFTVDLNEIPAISQVLDKICSHLNLSSQEFIDHLQTLAQNAKQMK